MSRLAATVRQSIPGRPDMILGALSGFALALAFGGPILGAMSNAWSGVVLPAFYNLSQTGLPFCG